MIATQRSTETHREIQPCTFLDDGVFATKNGRAGIVLKLRPYDSECMDEGDMSAAAHRWRESLRAFGSDFLIYQYLIKRKLNRLQACDRQRGDYLASKGLYSYSTYLVVLRNGIAVAPLRRAVEAFRSSVYELVPCADFGKEEGFSFFRQILNYDETLAGAIPLRHDTYIDYYATDSPIDQHRGLLQVRDHWVKVMVMEDTPASDDHADLLRPLREMDCEFIAVTEWRELSQQEADKVTLAKQTHFHRSKFASNFAGACVEVISKALGMEKTQEERPEDRQKDGASISMEKEIEELRADMAKNGTRLGEFALTVILFSRDKSAVDRSVSEAFKAAAISGLHLYLEIDNTLAAWFAALPGGRKHQRRSILLTDRNYADLSMLFAPATGNPRNEHLKADCLAVMETRQRTPYYANMHVLDVGHAPIIGKTGSGKTFMCNYLLRSALRYNPQIVVLDIGGSYKNLCSEVGGAYVEVGLDNPFTINPFCLPDTSANRKFMFAFVKVLIETGGYTMSVVEKSALYKALRGNRRLAELAAKLPESLQPYIGRWIGDGQYGDLFDNEHDTLTYSRFQVFEFEDSDEDDETLEPLLFYILHRASESIRGDGFKVMLLDEAWRLLENESIRRYVRRGLKTWRKRNAALWTATQSMEDMESTKMLETIVENSGSMVFLPNPKMNRDRYRSVFKLNEIELDYVLKMEMARESMWKPAQQPSKVVILDAGGNG